MDPMKNHRGKGLNCFKPPAVIGDDVAYLEFDKSPGEETKKATKNKKSTRRTTFGALKAVLNKAAPSMKKSRSDNSSKSIKSSLKSTKHHAKKSSSYMHASSHPKEIISRSNSNYSLICSSNSRDSCTSTSSFSRSSSESSDSKAPNRSESQDLSKGTQPINGQKIKKTDHHHHKNCDTDSSYKPKIEAYCVIMVCLAALLYCGKGYAIATCTLIWLLLSMVCIKKTLRRSFKERYFSETEYIDSKEYKKKFIMDGLLERNRPKLLHS